MALDYEPNNIETKSNIQKSFYSLMSDFENSSSYDDLSEEQEDSVVYSIMNIVDSNQFLLENSMIKNFL